MNLKDAYDTVAYPSGATWGEFIAGIEAGLTPAELRRAALVRYCFLPLRAERRHVRGGEILPLSADPAPHSGSCVARDQFHRDDDGA